MRPPSDLLSRFSGRVYRQTGVDIPAFPPDRPASASARYHRAGESWPLYAALDAPTVWAEWSVVTRGAIRPEDETRCLWELDVNDLPVLDLRVPDVREAMGVSEEELTGPRERAQQLGRRARRMGALGIVAPSAAHRGHWSLVVFRGGFQAVMPVGSREQHPEPLEGRSTPAGPALDGGRARLS